MHYTERLTTPGKAVMLAMFRMLELFSYTFTTPNVVATVISENVSGDKWFENARFMCGTVWSAIADETRGNN